MRFLKADKLFDGRTYLAEDSVLVLDNQNVLKEIVAENNLDKNTIEKFAGVITPGFVNAHCHLELSHLKGKIPRHTGLPAFAKQVVSLRHTIGREEVFSGMHEADHAMWSSGVVAVGDISNSEDSFKEKLNSKIYYHTFIELIGLNPVNAQTIFDKGILLLQKLLSMGLQGSLAPHAPYSTSKELIKRIADYNNSSGRSLSIHNQESDEETKFFMGQKSAFEDLYRSLGLDLSWFKPPGISSLGYYLEALSDHPSILVHNTFTSRADVDTTNDKNIYWCFCPGANKYIENSLPEFSFFANKKNKICLGTDSLASNSQLNVINEANLVLNHTQEFSPEILLQALTSSGAEALGISDKFGEFKPGKNTGLNLVEIKNSKLNFVKKIA